MHAEPEHLLKQALQKCIPILQPLASECLAPYQVWVKTGEGMWRGEAVPKPDVMKMLSRAESQIIEAGTPFYESFASHYPDYDGVVGLCQFGRHDLRGNRAYILLVTATCSMQTMSARSPRMPGGSST